MILTDPYWYSCDNISFGLCCRYNVDYNCCFSSFINIGECLYYVVSRIWSAVAFYHCCQHWSTTNASTGIIQNSSLAFKRLTIHLSQTVLSVKNEHRCFSMTRYIVALNSPQWTLSQHRSSLKIQTRMVYRYEYY